jgi:hypothetical protein
MYYTNYYDTSIGNGFDRHPASDVQIATIEDIRLPSPT